MMIGRKRTQRTQRKSVCLFAILAILAIFAFSRGNSGIPSHGFPSGVPEIPARPFRANGCRNRPGGAASKGIEIATRAKTAKLAKLMENC